MHPRLSSARSSDVKVDPREPPEDGQSPASTSEQPAKQLEASRMKERETQGSFLFSELYSWWLGSREVKIAALQSACLGFCRTSV